MTDMVVGTETYRLVVSGHDGQWTAHAVHAATGDRFGTTFTGATEADVVARLSAWLEWQREHAVALAALQSAEQAFHRTIAGSAFTNAGEAVENQKASLDQVEAARVRLDEVRARQPV
jgi:hypothetical protein